MKVKRVFLFILCTFLFLFYPGETVYFNIFANNPELFQKEETQTVLPTQPVPYVKNPAVPELTAEGVYIVDLPSFTPVFERNSGNHFYPASTAKIITALVAYDLFDVEDIVTVNHVLNEGQQMGLVVGENISVENLLYGTLVHSGNDAAYALADHYGYDKFINLMNEKTQKLGMKNSHFKNPAGLDDEEQVTTPFDLALAAREVLKNKLLSKIASTKEITVSDNDFIYFHQLSNVNKLLGEVHGVGGLKTGYTESAGENLVSFYKKNGHQYIVVIMKSLDRFNDTKNAVNWINANIDYIPL